MSKIKNTRKFKKFSIEELKDTWEKFGSDFFPNLEDYVIEVRKIESELHSGWITQEELKVENDEKINEI